MNIGHDPISIAVLAGGQSRRMGTDKALLRLQPEGPPLISIVLERLHSLTDDLFIVSIPRPAYREFSVPVVNDRYGDTGPLGAIATALSAAKHNVCLVASCDMPFLNQRLLSWMASRPRGYDVLIPELLGESRQGGISILQSMHALYARTCLTTIEAALQRGDRSTTSFHPGLLIETIPETIIRAIDPSLESFISINSPETLALSRSMM